MPLLLLTFSKVLLGTPELLKTKSSANGSVKSVSMRTRYVLISTWTVLFAKEEGNASLPGVLVWGRLSLYRRDIAPTHIQCAIFKQALLIHTPNTCRFGQVQFLIRRLGHTSHLCLACLHVCICLMQMWKRSGIGDMSCLCIFSHPHTTSLAPAGCWTLCVLLWRVLCGNLCPGHWWSSQWQHNDHRDR